MTANRDTAAAAQQAGVEQIKVCGAGAIISPGLVRVSLTLFSYVQAAPAGEGSYDMKVGGGALFRLISLVEPRRSWKMIDRGERPDAHVQSRRQHTG